MFQIWDAKYFVFNLPLPSGNPENFGLTSRANHREFSRVIFGLKNGRKPRRRDASRSTWKCPGAWKRRVFGVGGSIWQKWLCVCTKWVFLSVSRTETLWFGRSMNGKQAIPSLRHQPDDCSVGAWKWFFAEVEEFICVRFVGEFKALPPEWPKLPEISLPLSLDFTTATHPSINKAISHLEVLQGTMNCWSSEKRLVSGHQNEVICSARKRKRIKFPVVPENQSDGETLSVRGQGGDVFPGKVSRKRWL